MSAKSVSFLLRLPWVSHQEFEESLFRVKCVEKAPPQEFFVVFPSIENNFCSDVELNMEAFKKKGQ